MDDTKSKALQARLRRDANNDNCRCCGNLAITKHGLCSHCNSVKQPIFWYFTFGGRS